MTNCDYCHKEIPVGEHAHVLFDNKFRHSACERAYVEEARGHGNKVVTMEDVWGTFDAEKMLYVSRGMMLARGLGEVYGKHFTEEMKKDAIRDIPDVCPIWGDVLPYKSVTVVFEGDVYEQVIFYLRFVHGEDCLQRIYHLPNGRVAIRSNYMCW